MLNVDLTTPEAIVGAKGYNVAHSGLVDVFISQPAVEGSTVFSISYGRAFTIMRHPIILATSLFYYRRVATLGSRRVVSQMNDRRSNVCISFQVLTLKIFSIVLPC